MKITRYQLMDRIETLREQAQTINGQFTGSLFRFRQDAEAKPDPRELMQRYLEAEKRVATLQGVQVAYNVRVMVDVLGEAMSLQQAVKLIGSATRFKNNWLAAPKPGQENNNYVTAFYDLVRQKENLYAERVVSVEECVQLSGTASDLATALKQAIRSGNATEVELEVDSALFR